MEKLVEDLQAAITQAFESDEYDKQKREIGQRVGEQQEAKLSALSQKAESQRLHHGEDPGGAGLRTQDGRGRDHVPGGRTKRFRRRNRSTSTTASKALNEELQQIMRLVRQDERAGRDALRELDNEVTTYAAKHLIDEACEKWCEVAGSRPTISRPFCGTWSRTSTISRSPTRDSPVMFMGMPVSRRVKE